ncbi:MAG: hypothetical protein V4505_00930 [Pseudomonadota bacterium]
MVTVAAKFESEVHQGGLALVDKGRAAGKVVIWVDVLISDEQLSVDILIKPKDKPEDFTGSSFYMVSHGAGNKFANMPANIFCPLFERFASEYIGIHEGTKFNKLCLLACNAGKANEGVPTSYLADVAAGIKLYSFERIVAWNSWVSIYNLKQLLDLCRDRQGEIMKRAEALLSELEGGGGKTGETFAAAFRGDFKAVADTRPGSLQPFKVKLMPAFVQAASKLQGHALFELLGRRLIETKLGGVKNKVFSSPEKFHLERSMAERLVDPLADRVVLYKSQAHEARIMLLVKLGLTLALAGLIAEYEGSLSWVYSTNRMRLCHYPSSGTGASASVDL